MEMSYPVTPNPRKLTRALSDSPEGQRSPKVRRVTRAGEEAPKVVNKTSGVTDLSEQCAVLRKLFDGLEHVLMLFGSRKRRPTLEGEAGVRKTVETYTGRDLCDVRLGQLLALARTMLEVVWLGSGSGATLEIVQKAEDGEVRPATLSEMEKRTIRFDAALRAWACTGSLPQLELPARPGTSTPASLGSGGAAAQASEPQERHVDNGQVAQQQNQGPQREDAANLLGATLARKAGPTPSKPRTTEQRLAAMKMRILAKQEAERRQAAQQAAIRDLERSCAACEDAMALHGILEHLFARGKGENSATSEAEVMAAATSACYAVQFRRPMDAQAAQSALAHLTAKADAWYRVEDILPPQTRRYMQDYVRPQLAAVHSRTAGSFLRRIAGGNSKPVMEALVSELKDLQQRHKRLLEEPTTPAVEEASQPSSEGSPSSASSQSHQLELVPEASPSSASSQTPQLELVGEASPSSASSPVQQVVLVAQAPTPAKPSRGHQVRKGAAKAAAQGKVTGSDPAAKPGGKQEPARSRTRAASSHDDEAMAIAAQMPGPVTRRRLRLKLDLEAEAQGL